MRSEEKRNRLNQKFIFIVALILVATCSFSSARADEPKRTLNNNMSENDHTLPTPAEDLCDVFANGMFYGRLRTNYFYWENEEQDIHDPIGFGLGGSMIYKTAPFHGISGTVGLYTSQNFGLLNKEDAVYGRSGNATFSRYDKLAHGDWGMTVLAQAYLQYNIYQSDIKLGRLIFESFLTKSNDTKMIPNTFEGITFVSKDVPETTVTLGFFTAEKNRDHTSFHDVITYGDGKNRTVMFNGATINISRWNNQDDSASHKGLSYENLKAAGKDVDNTLLVAGITNQSIKDLKVDFGYNGVPDLFHSVMGEVNLKINLGKGWSLTPGLRCMEQFDDGAGKVGGASLTGALAGMSGPAMEYKDADSVDAKLFAARLVLNKGAGKLSAAYSKVSDDADIIAPWRGFPTNGYTRPMGEYNWIADTESWMFQAYYDFGKAGLINGFRASIDYLITDHDDEKALLGGASSNDRNVIHADLWYQFSSIPNMEAKLRLKSASIDRLTPTGTNPSYDELRFEINYLF